MKNLTRIAARLFILFFMQACDSPKPNVASMKGPDSTASLTVNIEAPDTVKAGTDLEILVRIGNNSNAVQAFLFDQPVPMNISVQLDDSRKHSVLRYGNKQVLSSQLYTEKELQPYYIKLRPSDKIERTFLLSELAVLNAPLVAGEYQLYIFFHNILSNTERIIVE